MPAAGPGRRCSRAEPRDAQRRRAARAAHEARACRTAARSPTDDHRAPRATTSSPRRVRPRLQRPRSPIVVDAPGVANAPEQNRSSPRRLALATSEECPGRRGRVGQTDAQNREGATSTIVQVTPRWTAPTSDSHPRPRVDAARPGRRRSRRTAGLEGLRHRHHGPQHRHRGPAQRRPAALRRRRRRPRAAAADGRVPLDRSYRSRPPLGFLLIDRRVDRASSSGSSRTATSPTLLRRRRSPARSSRFLPILLIGHPVRAGDGLRGVPRLPHARAASCTPATPASRSITGYGQSGRVVSRPPATDHDRRLRGVHPRRRPDHASRSASSLAVRRARATPSSSGITLVPAVMALLGERAWWMPKRLERLRARPRHRRREPGRGHLRLAPPKRPGRLSHDYVRPRVECRPRPVRRRQVHATRGGSAPWPVS